MRTAQVAVDYPAVAAAIAAALGATCHDRAPHRHPNNAPPETWRRYLALDSGIVVEAHWYSDSKTWMDFSWCNYPMDGNTQILPREAVTVKTGDVPEFYARANATRPAAAIAKEVDRKVIQPALKWLPHMHAFIARRRASEAAALKAAEQIASTYGSKFDPERDRRGPARYQVWIPGEAPFGMCSIEGYSDGTVSIYPERSCALNVAQLVAMVASYRTHMESSHD